MQSQQSHYTACYLVELPNGKIEFFSHRPTVDEPLQLNKPTIPDLDFDNSIGDTVVIHRYLPGARHPYESKGRIVAKQSYLWDPSKPLVSRRSKEQRSHNWNVVYSKFSEQTNQLLQMAV